MRLNKQKFSVTCSPLRVGLLFCRRLSRATRSTEPGPSEPKANGVRSRKAHQRSGLLHRARLPPPFLERLDHRPAQTSARLATRDAGSACGNPTRRRRADRHPAGRHRAWHRHFHPPRPSAQHRRHADAGQGCAETHQPGARGNRLPRDGDYDSETRFALDWFAAKGFNAGSSGEAINMTNAVNLASMQ